MIYPYLVQAGPSQKVVMQVSKDMQIPVSYEALRRLMTSSVQIYAEETRLRDILLNEKIV
ncbi:hypothetical protein [Sneathiella glossodoripedis]|uniref:hypothetical protein n=1 Tax=Sneathiella glossodoripedis TaxID=418853 RepID=UPI0004708FC3|nr:hypothetical protein [Sneathiella glossodoripedis]